MLTAQIADEDCSFLYGMPGLVGCCTHVDTVLVIEAAADGVPFNQPEAHFDFTAQLCGPTEVRFCFDFRKRG